MEVKFNGAELRLARVVNGFTLEEVAERINKTRQYLHKLEIGSATPTDELLSELASVLAVNPEFLTSPGGSHLDEEQFHFRKLFTTRAMVKQVAMARGELVGRLVKLLERELKLPEVNIPDFSDAKSPDEIEHAAENCRRAWELGMGPIAHMNRLAENVGAIVTSFQSISKEIDALSVAVSRPIIVRNEAKESICRQRFDIGHELGHFVLHSGQQTGDRITESQANRFASALLIPRGMMAKLFPRPRGSRLDWNGIREFKLVWKVSKAAILYRAHQLALITEDQYKSGVITLKRTGEAQGEREDYLIPVEKPELLENSLRMLADKKGMQIQDIAIRLNVSHQLLERIIGLSLSGTSQDGSASLGKRPALYLAS